MKKIRIGPKSVGDGEPPYFIADIAANHDGKLDRALRLIELAKEAGADAAKFQNFQASQIVSKHGFDALGKKVSHQAQWRKSVFEIYEEASISWDWTPRLKAKCDQVGIEYFSSPYDFNSVDHIDPYVRVYKIGSGDITWLEIIEYIAKKNKPVIMATGASTMNDVVRAMNTLEGITNDIVLMQCNTNYTASLENFKYVNLKVLDTYRNRFPDVILGLSDHTPGHAAVLGAIAMGARVFEKHFTDDNNREGPDHKFAMNPQSWKEMVLRANELYNALGDGIKLVENNESETVVVQRRALRFLENFSKGHVLDRRDLFPTRPCPLDAIPPFEIKSILGKKLARDVLADDYVHWADLS